MNINTKIIYEGGKPEVINAIYILYRDMFAVFNPSKIDGGIIRLIQHEMPEELFFIRDGDIYAGDELGFIYGLLHISEHVLKIPPFWFWYDHVVSKVDTSVIDDFISKPKRVRFRGWFINDEILLSNWSPDNDPLTPWKMAYEALLRCGGNMVIPTTQVSRVHSDLAATYGLWLTHHHAEPLGADMFVRAYPDLEPSYDLYEDKFKQLWLDGIEHQRNHKVVWNIGFRGQGDLPFWGSSGSNKYDTDEKRGDLISGVLQYQYDLLKENVESPVCCTYIYGELTDLYKKGFLRIPEDVIKIWSDNGYGKMVSRRMDDHNPRTPALPESKDELSGIYYHVSFCDMQACSHITQIGNSLEFLTSELENAFDHGADDYVLVNCSNIRPHVAPLAMIAELWKGNHFCLESFCEVYYRDKSIATAFIDYAKAAVSFGAFEDEHAGDHFYNFGIRAIISSIMKNETSVSQMFWATGDVLITDQLHWFGGKCSEGVVNYHSFLEKHNRGFGRLFDTTILLYAKLHYHGYKGGALFVRGCMELFKENYINAFYCIGLAMDEFAFANGLLRNSEYGVWRGYHANECFADYKFTAYLLRVFMAFIRNFGDGPGYWDWQRELFYPAEDKGVRLQMNLHNRDTEEEMFRKMKESGYVV